MKIAIITIAAVVAAVVIVRTWRKGSDVDRVLAYIKKLAEAVRADVNSAHTRVDEYARITNRFSGRLHWLESQAKSVAERLRDANGEDEIESLKERVERLEKR